MPCGSKVRLTSRKASYRVSPNILRMKRAAHQAVAMLAGESSAEFEYQACDVVGNGLELTDTGFGFHIDHGANVQATNGGVRIDSSSCVMAAKRVPETGR